MKKLYLLLLVFLLLFIPATNAVTPYQLDHPIKELNNHTLREVFEDGNDFNDAVWTASSDLTIIDNEIIRTIPIVSSITLWRINVNIPIVQDNHYYLNYYAKYENIDNAYFRVYYAFIDYGILNITQTYINTSLIFNGHASWNDTYFDFSNNVISSHEAKLYIKEPIRVNLTALGIDNLTTEQIENYYDYYLKAVQFEIDYYEAGQDPGEYQHIFKSILNGVKNLLSEMGYVWQWLNAPIITTDMQDYSFNIDWSWDLIGVIRQIMNSAGILTLQIAFWVPSLAFAFMGIPVQVSVLSLLFSNLIFLLLGWILVKSLLI